MVSSHAASRRRQTSSEQSSPVQPNLRLRRDQRLRQSRLFKEVFDQRRCFVGKLVVIWLRQGRDAALRLGVVVGKKAFRKAVQRSRARRLLREAFRLNRHRLVGNYDVVLVARPPILKALRQDVERELLRLARQAGILRE